MTATLIMLLGVSSTAQAMVPAGSRITSTSTLEFNDDAAPLTATVTVTVGLQRSKPLIALKAGTATQPNPSSAKWINETTESLTYKYTITTEANGPADYTVNAEAAAEAVENLNKKPRVKLNGNKESITITLGATAVLEVVGNKITVPSDGKANNAEHQGKVNGIQKNDKVSIKGSDRVYTVLAVEDLGHDGGATITLDDEPGNLETGTPIAEQQEFTVDLGEIRLKDTDKTQVVAVTITVSQGEKFVSLDVTTAPSFTVIAPRGPKMQIWVRNLSQEVEANPNPASEGLKTKTYPEIGGNIYFSTHDDPHHRPGSILEYLVTVRAGNEGPLTDQRYQIPKPDDLKHVLEYVAGETRLNAGERIPDEDIEQGVPLSNDAEQNPNAIDTDQTAYVTYQMKVIGGVGGDIDLSTPEGIKLACNGSNPESFDKDLCHLQPWVADNGIDPNTNPVCSERMVAHGQAWDGVNPWVVGRAKLYNQEAYDCRTECARKTGESFDHCAADRWWDKVGAQATVCRYGGGTREWYTGSLDTMTGVGRDIMDGGSHICAPL